MISKRAVIFILVLVAARSGFGQGAERFAGRWIDIKDKNAQRTLVITVTGAEVILEETFLSSGRSYTNTHRLNINKTGETNFLIIPGAANPSEVVSTTHLEKDKLVRKSSYKTTMDPPRDSTFSVVDIREEYSLSSDGQKLKRKTKGYISARSVPQNPAERMPPPVPNRVPQNPQRSPSDPPNGVWQGRMPEPGVPYVTVMPYVREQTFRREN